MPKGEMGQRPEDEQLNIEEAEVSAYAEKPLRDIAGRGGITSGEKKTLADAAELTGEKALGEYKKEKGEGKFPLLHIPGYLEKNPLVKEAEVAMRKGNFDAALFIGHLQLFNALKEKNDDGQKYLDALAESSRFLVKYLRDSGKSGREIEMELSSVAENINNNSDNLYSVLVPRIGEKISGSRVSMMPNSGKSDNVGEIQTWAVKNSKNFTEYRARVICEGTGAEFFEEEKTAKKQGKPPILRVPEIMEKDTNAGPLTKELEAAAGKGDIEASLFVAHLQLFNILKERGAEDIKMLSYLSDCSRDAANFLYKQGKTHKQVLDGLTNLAYFFNDEGLGRSKIRFSVQPPDSGSSMDSTYMMPKDTHKRIEHVKKVNSFAVRNKEGRVMFHAEVE